LFKPKPRPRAVQARAWSSDANVLTWEPAANDVNGNSIGSKPVGGKGSNVVIAGDLGPVLRKHATGEGFNFAEGNGFKAARALKAKAETAYAAE
jgi:hypothetical protein